MSYFWKRPPLRFRSEFSQCLRPRQPGQRRANCRADHGLRILFCGSDIFSVASLKRLHRESIENPELVSSIDVVSRPGKRAGRGMKQIKDVPILGAARELGLPVHELANDTFTSWKPPVRKGQPINLIIAVSFGLKVPERLLRDAKWGGLNVHPSLLPDLRGPAPLHHALLYGRKHIGITLQTLHPTKFDHGTILAQTPLPGLVIPNNGICTVPQLVDFVAPKAANMLVEGLRRKIFVRQIQDCKETGPVTPILVDHLVYAPKITQEAAKIDWNSWRAERIVRTARVLGRLWNKFTYKLNGENHNVNIKVKRIIFEGVTDVTAVRYGTELPKPVPKPGTMETRCVGDQLLLDIWTCDQRLVNVETVTMDGRKPRLGAKALPRSLESGLCLAGKDKHTSLS